MKDRLLLVSRKWPPSVGGMETYSVELAASLGENFDTDTLALRGREDGLAPGLLAYGWFLLKAMGICLLHGRAYRKVVFATWSFPRGGCHWLVARRPGAFVIVYGLDCLPETQWLATLLYRLFSPRSAHVRPFSPRSWPSRLHARLAEEAVCSVLWWSILPTKQ